MASGTLPGMDIVRISVPSDSAAHQVFPVSGSQMNPEAVQALINLDPSATIEIVSAADGVPGDGIPVGPGGRFTVASGQEPAWAVNSSGSAVQVVAVAALGEITVPIVSPTGDVASGTVALVAGSKAVANAAVTSSTRIRLTNAGTAGTAGILSYSLTAGTGFTIHSSSGSDTSTIFWEIVAF